MKTSGSIPAAYVPGIEPLRFLGCLIERLPDGQLIMHQRSYIEHCIREMILELMRSLITLPNVDADEKSPPEEPFDDDGYPTKFENSKSTCQKYSGQFIRPTYVVTCLTHLWKYLKGTHELEYDILSMRSYFGIWNSAIECYVDASISSGGSRSRSGMANWF